MSRMATPAALVAALVLAVLAPGVNASTDPGPSSRLVVVATSDVKGKTSPCGCHVPKGGFARRESLIDSLRAENPHFVAVDAGGWFPSEPESLYRDAATFVAAEMAVAGLDAVGASERELRFGLPFLESLVKRTQLPLTSANLVRKADGKPVFPPYRLVRAEGVTVGVFSLLSNRYDLGPDADALTVEDPATCAKRVVAEMRAKGAGPVVLLSSLGKVPSEDLAVDVPGIDAVIASHDVPVVEKGRVIGGALIAYGGEQGHYATITTLGLDAKGRVDGGSAVTLMLSPEIPDKPATLNRVRAFEDVFNGRLRAWQRENGKGTEAVPATTAR